MKDYSNDCSEDGYPILGPDEPLDSYYARLKLYADNCPTIIPIIHKENHRFELFEKYNSEQPTIKEDTRGISYLDLSKPEEGSNG